MIILLAYINYIIGVQLYVKMLGRFFARPVAFIGRIDISSHSAASAAAFTRAMSSENRSYETLTVATAAPFVTHVTLNRPDKRNAMNRAFWR